jgi:hypothetical protein
VGPAAGTRVRVPRRGVSTPCGAANHVRLPWGEAPLRSCVRARSRCRGHGGGLQELYTETELESFVDEYSRRGRGSGRELGRNWIGLSCLYYLRFTRGINPIDEKQN